VRERKNQTKYEPFLKRKKKNGTSNYEKRGNCGTLFFMT
jgi:hypothetical protein